MFQVWLCIAIASFAVGTCLFVLSKLNSYVQTNNTQSAIMQSNINHNNNSTTSQNSQADSKGTGVPEEAPGVAEDVKVDRSPQFNFHNSMWFTLASLMQQGCDVTPNTVSGRIIGIQAERSLWREKPNL